MLAGYLIGGFDDFDGFDNDAGGDVGDYGGFDVGGGDWGGDGRFKSDAWLDGL